MAGDLKARIVRRLAPALIDALRRSTELLSDPSPVGRLSEYWYEERDHWWRAPRPTVGERDEREWERTLFACDCGGPARNEPFYCGRCGAESRPIVYVPKSRLEAEQRAREAAEGERNAGEAAGEGLAVIARFIVSDGEPPPDVQTRLDRWNRWRNSLRPEAAPTDNSLPLNDREAQGGS